MWANPGLYSSIPVHVQVDGGAESVVVQLGGARPIEASFSRVSGDWIADVPISGGADAELLATASGNGAELSATATLRLGSDGVQFTDVDIDGLTNNPTLHRSEERVLLTWTDDTAAERAAYVAPLDGAAARLADPVRLTPPGEDAFMARTAIGDEAVAVLYSVPATPFDNYLRIVDLDGTELLAPISLEPGPESASNGAAIAWDGSGFVATWRVQGGGEDPRVRWMRLDASDWSATGPVTIADTSGGDFVPFTVVGIEAIGDRSAVSFTRYVNNAAGDVLKAQLAVVNSDGTVDAQHVFGSASDFFWHHEVRLGQLDEQTVAVWPADDLTNPAIPIPTELHAAVVDRAALDSGPDDPAIALSGPDFRSDPRLVDTAGPGGVMAWFDNRNNQGANGHIELREAAVDPDLAAGEQRVFEHARIIEGAAHLRGIASGSNVLLVWIDQRDGGSILNPRPEIYFETAWH